MSRLEIDLPKRAEVVMEGLYKDLERRIESSSGIMSGRYGPRFSGTVPCTDLRKVCAMQDRSWAAEPFY